MRIKNQHTRIQMIKSKNLLDQSLYQHLNFLINQKANIEKNPVNNRYVFALQELKNKYNLNYVGLGKYVFTGGNKSLYLPHNHAINGQYLMIGLI